MNDTPSELEQWLLQNPLRRGSAHSRYARLLTDSERRADALAQWNWSSSSAPRPMPTWKPPLAANTWNAPTGSGDHLASAQRCLGLPTR